MSKERRDKVKNDMDGLILSIKENQKTPQHSDSVGKTPLNSSNQGKNINQNIDLAPLENRISENETTIDNIVRSNNNQSVEISAHTNSINSMKEKVNLISDIVTTLHDTKSKVNGLEESLLSKLSVQDNDILALNNKISNLQDIVRGKTSDVPVGHIIAMITNDVPTNYLPCDGRAILRLSYPELFKSIGTQFGAGDGDDTFNLPDLRGLFLRGSVNKNQVGKWQASEVGSHRHIVANCMQQTGWWGASPMYFMSDQKARNHSSNPMSSFPLMPDGSEGKETRPENVSVNWLIKIR